ncbi:MAG: hypothetical protein JSS17_13695 [Proteobacteria bacterium]|nr:hypothetical protein [Pseudomonadota bacterium]
MKPIGSAMKEQPTSDGRMIFVFFIGATMDFSFFWVLNDSSAAGTLSKRAVKSFEVLVKSGRLDDMSLGWLARNGGPKPKLVKTLFAAICGRTDVDGLRNNNPPPGAIKSSLSDEQCTKDELAQRRKLQAAAAYDFLATRWPRDGSRRGPLSMESAARLIDAWQPTAERPTVDATIEQDFVEAERLIGTLLGRMAMDLPVTPTQKERSVILTAIERVPDIKDWSKLIAARLLPMQIALLQCDAGELATRIINDHTADAALHRFGLDLLERLTAKDDPYACIQLATLLSRHYPQIKPNSKRALDLAWKGVKAKDQLRRKRKSLAEAYEIIGPIYAFDHELENRQRALEAFQEGAEWGSFICAVHAAALLGHAVPPGKQKRTCVELQPAKALYFLGMAKSEFNRASASVDHSNLRDIEEFLNHLREGFESDCKDACVQGEPA